MGINNLAVQTFSSSGSQSVCRANKADSSRQITSDFISRPEIKYINGSGLSVINGTMKILPNSENYTETFRIPNNIDAISEMVLSMDLNLKKASGTYACDGIFYSKTFLLDVINNIEIKMGGLIIQTIYPGDIYMRNYSELGTLISHENSFKLIKNSDYVDTGSIIGYTTSANNVEETISFSLSIPFIGRSSDKERSFLQTGSFTKNLVVTVNYNPLFVTATVTPSYGRVISLLHNRAGSATDETTVTTTTSTSIETKLCILSHIITDTEKNFIKQNIVNRVINTSAGIVIRNITEKYIKSVTGKTAIEIDLDSIDLNVTHLLFCLNVNLFNQGGSSVYPVQFIKNSTPDEAVTPTQLSSNSQYTSGLTKLSSSWGIASLDSNISNAQIANPDVLGVFNGWLASAELVLGTETTGQIQCSVLTSNQVEFNLTNISENFYILKMADNAFSTAGVPFSRIKNKKLILTVRNKFFNKDAANITVPTAANSTSNIMANPIGPYQSTSLQSRDATISVCACGTTLQIVNNNTISFSYI